MVKKLKAMADKQKKNASGAALFDNALAASVRESAEKIWLAGMGAFAKAQAEGKQVFDALVRDGATLQKKTQSAAEDKFGEVQSRMTSMAEDVQQKAGKQWDKLESIFEDRTARAMQKLGMPTAQEMRSLQARVAELEAKAGAKPAAARKTASRKSAPKSAPKAATTRKTVAKKAATA